MKSPSSRHVSTPRCGGAARAAASGEPAPAVKGDGSRPAYTRAPPSRPRGTPRATASKCIPPEPMRETDATRVHMPPRLPPLLQTSSALCGIPHLDIVSLPYGRILSVSLFPQPQETVHDPPLHATPPSFRPVPRPPYFPAIIPRDSHAARHRLQMHSSLNASTLQCRGGMRAVSPLL